MSESDYQLAWMIYLAAALLCIGASFYFTRWMWRYLREPIRVVVAVVLLTPSAVMAEKALYAPAFVIASIEYFLNKSIELISVTSLLTYLILGLGAYVLFALLRWGWHKYRAKQVTSAAKDEAVEAAGVEPVESFSVTADEGIGRTSQTKLADMTLGERLAAEQKQRIEPVLGDNMGAGSSKDV